MWTQSACHSAYDRTALDMALRKKEVILRALTCKDMDFAEVYSSYYTRENTVDNVLDMYDRRGLKFITSFTLLWYNISYGTLHGVDFK